MARPLNVLLLFLLLWLSSQEAVALEHDGRVCLGPNLSVVLSDREHVMIAIGEIRGIRFSHDNAPKMVAEGLDRARSYPVTIFYDGKPVESWMLDFRKLRSKVVYIWRAKGSYRMEAAKGHDCSWPPKLKEPSPAH